MVESGLRRLRSEERVLGARCAVEEIGNRSAMRRCGAPSAPLSLSESGRMFERFERHSGKAVDVTVRGEV